MKITRENLVNHLIQKELDYVGKTIEEIKNDPEWYRNYTLTEEQHKEWKEYSMKTIKKVLKTTKLRTESEFAWLDLMYGLRVLQNDNNNS
jgi:hypothetical protein